MHLNFLHSCVGPRRLEGGRFGEFHVTRLVPTQRVGPKEHVHEARVLGLRLFKYANPALRHGAIEVLQPRVDPAPRSLLLKLSLGLLLQLRSPRLSVSYSLDPALDLQRRSLEALGVPLRVQAPDLGQRLEEHCVPGGGSHGAHRGQGQRCQHRRCGGHWLDALPGSVAPINPLDVGGLASAVPALCASRHALLAGRVAPVGGLDLCGFRVPVQPNIVPAPEGLDPDRRLVAFFRAIPLIPLRTLWCCICRQNLRRLRRD
mmetsp:Transcript_62486/g.111332  ORF Transcript_62486/g.111332 Transcript_62486/m.111332 type:complete len:260 (-) Transcript_62486:2297-3076(-)